LGSSWGPPEVPLVSSWGLDMFCCHPHNGVDPHSAPCEFSR